MNILIALISGLCVAIPSIVATIVTSRDNKNIIAYRIEKKKKKVMAHNNLIDRMYKVENRITLVEDDVKDLKR